MNKLKERFIKYKEKKGIKGIIYDGAFFVLIVLLIVPTTRKYFLAMFISLGVIQPSVNIETADDLNTQSWQWEFQDETGNTFMLNDFKGKVVFINYWATWCPPCIAEMPAIQKLYDEYGDKMVFIIATNEGPAKVNKFASDNGFNLPFYYYKYQLPDQLTSSSIPQTFVISKDGKIVIDKSGAAKWNGSKMKRQYDDLIK